MSAPTGPNGPTVTLSAEDTKLLTLARGARLRAYGDPATARGAAIRDSDGRTYAAASVAHPHADTTTSALRGAYVAAVSSGARQFEAAVQVSIDPELDLADIALLADLCLGMPIHLAGPDGVPVAVATVATVGPVAKRVG